jgi:hypothetical protein
MSARCLHHVAIIRKMGPVPFLVMLALLMPSTMRGAHDSGEPASTLLDLSGIAWMDDDLFLAVHDSKSVEEPERPRASVVIDASTPEGVLYHQLEIDWPEGSLSNDLESIARVPGTHRVLLLESGDDGNAAYRRIFLATFDARPPFALKIDAVVPWPEPVFNVEAAAIFDMDGARYFVYAERADSQPVTEIRWAPVRIEDTSIEFGSFAGVLYAAGIAGPGVRPIVALDIDSEGHVFAVTAFDSDNDNGPFRSVVSMIGQFQAEGDGRPMFVPSGMFGTIAQGDGFKIEGITVVEQTGEPSRIYVGTDDENYGATLRQVWPMTRADDADDTPATPEAA